MRKLAGLAGAIVLVTSVGACSSSGSSASGSTGETAATPRSGTETVTGTVTGAAVADWLNSQGSTPPPLSSLVFTGPVNTSISGPVILPSSNAETATLTIATPEGNLTVQRTIITQGGQMTVTGQSGSMCYFTLNGGTGTYTVLGSKSTGKFAGATGSGTYANTIQADANLPQGNTNCSASTTGSILAMGTSYTFTAFGPLTRK